jgi:predicted dehydrogenase
MTAVAAPVKVVLFGTGAMGRNHGRALRQLSGVHIVGVVEPDLERGAAFANELGVAYFPSLEAISTKFDAAVIATPTHSHETLTIACLERGAHVLVEKPIAVELSAAARMVEAADELGLVLMVGHIERFNGAVRALPQFLDDPIHFECKRVGPFDSRILDGIILDLMIHDLDLVSHLTMQPGTPQGSVGVALHGRQEDHATANVMFGKRISACFTASRVGQTKSRTMEIVQPTNAISVDLIRQDITIHTVESVDFSGPGNMLRQRGIVEIPFIERSGQPLTAELLHFIDCVQNKTECLTPGIDGLKALELVRQVEAVSLRINR